MDEYLLLSGYSTGADLGFGKGGGALFEDDFFVPIIKFLSTLLALSFSHAVTGIGIVQAIRKC